MCGISGILKYKVGNSTGKERAIYAMTNAMVHRGPDASGHYEDDYIALGHRRLSIIDLSLAGNQPFSSSDGRYKMVFNGELYNFRDVRAQIKDHTFKSSGDTEVLIEGWARWGQNILAKLKGMFSFAIWDTQKKELVICRDRLGVKPLYYYEDDERLIFASEIRSVLAAGGIRRKANPLALYSFLSYQSVTGEQTIIDGIRELQAGHIMFVREGKIEIKRYWDITQNDDLYNGEDITTVRKTIRELLRTAVEQRLVSDVPVGAFLSGGIDSSAVVGLMAEVSTQKVETFNISFQETDFDESVYANTVAKKFNTNHHRILLKPEILLDSLFPALDALDTPSGDGINSYIVSKAIRDAGITVALSGVGGDELFAGYPFFAQYRKLRRMEAFWNISRGVRNIANGLITANSTRKERIKQLLAAGECDIKNYYSAFREILPASSINRLSKLTQTKQNKMYEILTKYPAIENFPDYSQVSIAEYLGYTQHTLLKDMDQMSMAVSLEVREPFFDHELVAYVLQIPDKYKHPAYPKQLLVESLNGLLPDEIVHRKKQGFVFPWKEWMKTSLRDFCSGKINAISQRDFINGPALLQRWNDFLNNKAAINWMELWIFVVLEYWLNKNEIE